MLTHIHSTIRCASLLSTALLACSAGFRHAVDVDHRSAVDTVTRERMRGRANGGAFVRPIRKLRHNLTITTVSALLNRFGEMEVTT
jgi:high-affinity nickel permease